MVRKYTFRYFFKFTDQKSFLDFDGDDGQRENVCQAKKSLTTPSGVNRTSAESEDQMYSNFRVANSEGGHVTLSQAHFDDLHANLQRMQLVIDESNATLKQYQKDMESMRKACCVQLHT